MSQTRGPTTAITVQPADEYGAREVWAAYDVYHAVLGSFTSDGVMGHLYRLGERWVFVNELGHPTMVFETAGELDGWLQSLSPSVVWPNTYQQPEDRA